MYYSNGNYEAFARPLKPVDVDKKSAYLVGAGLGSLAAACFLVRDGQMKGENIHILKNLDISGGACDGIKEIKKDLLFVVAVKWKTTLNAYGIYSVLFLLLRQKAFLF